MTLAIRIDVIPAEAGMQRCRLPGHRIPAAACPRPRSAVAMTGAGIVRGKAKA